MRKLIGFPASEVMARTVVSEHFFNRDLTGINRSGNACDVEKMSVIQIIVDAVFTPTSTPHRQGKGKSVFKTASSCKAMCLVDDYTAYRKFQPQLQGSVFPRGMQANRVPFSLVIQDSECRMLSFFKIRYL